ncbi:hypothetical protein MANES_02G064202v8 [Manihot esculenta]|uniref:Uncharacterized protein n=1 Tax=Manihot esculenta TaxID=3983 RepID=A0ACB7I3S2_MANES|nr:hypothetical protein MANES_02G064202v8 [Manihot esculenta]
MHASINLGFSLFIFLNKFLHTINLWVSPLSFATPTKERYNILMLLRKSCKLSRTALFHFLSNFLNKFFFFSVKGRRLRMGILTLAIVFTIMVVFIIGICMWSLYQGKKVRDAKKKNAAQNEEEQPANQEEPRV